jgi:hypothetical protein
MQLCRDFGSFNQRKKLLFVASFASPQGRCVARPIHHRAHHDRAEDRHFDRAAASDDMVLRLAKIDSASPEAPQGAYFGTSTGGRGPQTHVSARQHPCFVGSLASRLGFRIEPWNNNCWSALLARSPRSEHATSNLFGFTCRALRKGCEHRRTTLFKTRHFS